MASSSASSPGLCTHRRILVGYGFIAFIPAIVLCIAFYTYYPVSAPYVKNDCLTLGSIPRQSDTLRSSVSTNIHPVTERQIDQGTNSFGSIPCGPRGSNMARHFPQVIIFGLRKGGTRALIDMLSSHPKIVSPKEEMHFFDYSSHYGKGLQWYIGKMPCSKPDQITMEKSPRYFQTAKTASRMAKTAGIWLKLILIVRDPIERAISDYVQQVIDGKKIKRGKSFEELAINPNGMVNVQFSPIYTSMYDIHMERWLKYFKRQQILVVSGDTLIDNPSPVLRKVEKFLGVNPYFNEEMFYFNQTKGFYCWKRTDDKGIETPFCLRKSKGREHPEVNDRTISKLKLFFKPHNRKFYSLVGKDFGW